MIDDYDELSVVPIEVKSGKDYTVHSALNHFMLFGKVASLFQKSVSEQFSNGRKIR